MPRLLLLLFLVQLVLAVIALIDCISANDSDLRGLPKIAWVLIILFFPLIGSIVYFLAGRPITTASRPDLWRNGGGFPEAKRPGRPLAPDDDPEFLRSLRIPQKDVPTDDKPKADKPKADKPKQDRPKQDRPKQDRPKDDRPKG